MRYSTNISRWWYITTEMLIENLFTSVFCKFFIRVHINKILGDDKYPSKYTYQCKLLFLQLNGWWYYLSLTFNCEKTDFFLQILMKGKGQCHENRWFKKFMRKFQKDNLFKIPDNLQLRKCRLGGKINTPISRTNMFFETIRFNV